MKHLRMLFLVLFGACVHSSNAAAATGVSVRLEPNYVAGTVPTKMTIDATLPDGLAASKWIKFTFGTALCDDGSLSTVAYSGTGCGNVFEASGTANRCLCGGTGTTLTCTDDGATGTTSGGSSCTFEFTTALIGTLPSAGVVSIAIVDTDGTNTLTTDSTLLATVDNPTVTVDGLLSPGDAPTKITVETKNPFPLSASDKIQITASSAVWVHSSTTTVATKSGSVNLGTPTVATVSTTVTDVTVTAGVAVNQAIGLEFTSPILATNVPAPSPVAVTFSISMGPPASYTNAGYTSVQTATGYTVALADPITFVNGTKVKFWIPPNVYSTLVSTPEMQLMASPIVGPTPDLQWFDRFVGLLPDGGELFSVGVRRHVGNRTTFKRGRFNQLEIKLFGQTAPEEKLRSQLYESNGVKVGFGQDFWGRPRTHSGEMAEYLVVETPSIVFVVFASHAGTEFPHNRDMQMMYTHLDYLCLEVDEYAKYSFKGILPEIWGYAPLTENVASMLTPPSEIKQLEGPDGKCHGDVCVQKDEYGKPMLSIIKRDYFNVGSATVIYPGLNDLAASM